MQTENSDANNIGVVYKRLLGQYTVHLDNRAIPCVLSSKLWKTLEPSYTPGENRSRAQNVNVKHMDPVAIGDRVQIILAEDGRGMIVAVLPRHNYFARASAKPRPGAHAFEQVIAANLDQVIPVFSAANPKPKWHLLDRYLVTAESYQLKSQIIITKCDLIWGHPAERDLMTAVQRYRQIGYPVILTSAKDSQGVESFRQALLNRRSVLVGKSGVGKSTLMNALEPGLGLRIQAVNQTTGKGRHTTTYFEMFPLSFGGDVIDTPGVREFGIWGLEPEDVAFYFPEMAPLIGQCKFGMSCQHDEEPGCAIRQAVEEGRISPYRYKSYLRLKDDL